jgi:hypothetical protein
MFLQVAVQANATSLEAVAQAALPATPARTMLAPRTIAVRAAVPGTKG